MFAFISTLLIKIFLALISKLRPYANASSGEARTTEAATTTHKGLGARRNKELKIFLPANQTPAYNWGDFYRQNAMHLNTISLEEARATDAVIVTQEKSDTEGDKELKNSPLANQVHECKWCTPHKKYNATNYEIASPESSSVAANHDFQYSKDYNGHDRTDNPRPHWEHPDHTAQISNDSDDDSSQEPEMPLSLLEGELAITGESDPGPIYSRTYITGYQVAEQVIINKGDYIDLQMIIDNPANRAIWDIKNVLNKSTIRKLHRAFDKDIKNYIREKRHVNFFVLIKKCYTLAEQFGTDKQGLFFGFFLARLAGSRSNHIQIQDDIHLLLPTNLVKRKDGRKGKRGVRN